MESSIFPSVEDISLQGTWTNEAQKTSLKINPAIRDWMHARLVCMLCSKISFGGSTGPKPLVLRDSQDMAFRMFVFLKLFVVQLSKACLSLFHFAMHSSTYMTTSCACRALSLSTSSDIFFCCSVVLVACLFCNCRFISS